VPSDDGTDSHLTAEELYAEETSEKRLDKNPLMTGVLLWGLGQDSYADVEINGFEDLKSTCHH